MSKKYIVILYLAISLFLTERAGAECNCYFNWFCSGCSKIGARTTGEEGPFATMSDCESAARAMRSNMDSMGGGLDFTPTCSCSSNCGTSSTPSAGGGGYQGGRTTQPSYQSPPQYDYLQNQRQEEARRKEEADKKAQEAKRRQEVFERNKQELLNSMKGTTGNELGLKGTVTASGLGLKGTGTTGSGDLKLKTVSEKLDVEEERARMVAQDLKSYKSQLQQLMKEIGHTKEVPAPSTGNYIREGIMLGLFSPDESAFIGVDSPFIAGRKYKEGEVFATTNVGYNSEYIRGLVDSNFAGLYTLMTPYGRQLIERLRGKKFGRLIAHSNGATIAEALIRMGIIEVDELYVVGADRSYINKAGLQELIDSKRVNNVVAWNNPADIVPKGSSWVLPPTPVKPSYSIPIRTVTERALRWVMNAGYSPTKVEYVDLKGSQYTKGQIGQETPADSNYFDENHGLLTSYFVNFRTRIGPNKEKR